MKEASVVSILESQVNALRLAYETLSARDGRIDEALEILWILRKAEKKLKKLKKINSSKKAKRYSLGRYICTGRQLNNDEVGRSYETLSFIGIESTNNIDVTRVRADDSNDQTKISNVLKTQHELELYFKVT